VTYPEVSRSMMENNVKHIISSGADTVVTCEPGCLMNVAGGLHKAGSSIRVMHIIVTAVHLTKEEIAAWFSKHLGITETDYLLPETGTLVLKSSTEKPRAVSLLPSVHLAIVRPEKLHADMHHVFAEAKDSNYLVFITGPSRTADIELSR
jgi:L-lactate utilization protein LutC